MVDASDELRLAAGWRQEVMRCDPCHFGPMDFQESTPKSDPLSTRDLRAAPGVAGIWRLHSSGVWVRWIIP